MITNQIMKRPLADFTVEQRTKDGYFCLTGLLNNWNLKMGTKKELKDYFENKATQEFVKSSCRRGKSTWGQTPICKIKGSSRSWWWNLGGASVIVYRFCHVVKSALQSILNLRNRLQCSSMKAFLEPQKMLLII